MFVIFEKAYILFRNKKTLAYFSEVLVTKKKKFYNFVTQFGLVEKREGRQSSLETEKKVF